VGEPDEWMVARDIRSDPSLGDSSDAHLRSSDYSLHNTTKEFSKMLNLLDSAYFSGYEIANALSEVVGLGGNHMLSPEPAANNTRTSYTPYQPKTS